MSQGTPALRPKATVVVSAQSFPMVASGSVIRQSLSAKNRPTAYQVLLSSRQYRRQMGLGKMNGSNGRRAGVPCDIRDRFFVAGWCRSATLAGYVINEGNGAALPICADGKALPQIHYRISLRSVTNSCAWPIAILANEG